jgi:hypothetical protein
VGDVSSGDGEVVATGISQFMFRAIKLAAALGKLERSRALHIKVKPIPGDLDLSEGHDLRGKIVFHDKMIALPQAIPLVLHGDYDLASAVDNDHYLFVAEF